MSNLNNVLLNINYDLLFIDGYVLMIFILSIFNEEGDIYEGVIVFDIDKVIVICLYEIMCFI